ncbi:bacillithiol system protein YtxJ [Alteribacillus persepolensis]|uniref:Bacillithiol system protein YtxJ n=1 Tax=Alteribacillus persepolensis TaxID=568899 RepID=A0A1G7Z3V3_9BACI|nr:bacillithiol system redox-active protein YtxJ [Alteribacillus persepolensis]SDH03344.1 bacillithiol system protein YtxJ [Alteribacillus persepolensis]
MAYLQEITTSEEWKETLKVSQEKEVLLVKHSTTCPISAAAWDEVQKVIEKNTGENTVFAYVKVIESRPVSQQIAKDTGVKHESPQALLMKDRRVTWDASHGDVTEEALDAVLHH